MAADNQGMYLKIHTLVAFPFVRRTRHYCKVAYFPADAFCWQSVRFVSPATYSSLTQQHLQL